MNKVIVFFIVGLVAGGIGFIWSIYDYKVSYNLSIAEVIEIIKTGLKRNKLPREPISPLEEPIPPKKDLPETKPPSPPPPSEDLPSVDIFFPEDLAWQIIKEAEAAYQQFDFSGALNKLGSLEGKKLPEPVARPYNELKSKCTAFKELLSEETQVDQNMFKKIWEITLTSGAILEGELVAQDSKGLKIKTTGNIFRYIPLSNVIKYRQIPEEENKAKLKEKYEKAIAKLTPTASAKEYFRLAVSCYRNRLNDETLKLLEQAWQKDPNLLQSIQEENARALYETYQYLRQKKLDSRAEQIKKELKKKYPDSKYVAMLEEGVLTSQEHEPPPPKIIPIPQNEWQKKLAEAEQYYKKGRMHLEKTFDHGPDFNEQNNLAKENLEKALDIYQALELSCPTDTSISDRINEITQLLLYIRKVRRLGH